MNQPTLILVCGLPGSGKTTLAKSLELERQAIRFCPDDWIEALLQNEEDIEERDRLRDPVENLQWDLAQSYLGKGLTVILENGFWAEEERYLYAMPAIELGARVELYYLQAPDPEQLWNRIKSRNEEIERKTFVMSEQELIDAFAIFQPPTAHELEFYDYGEIVNFGQPPNA